MLERFIALTMCSHPFLLFPLCIAGPRLGDIKNLGFGIDDIACPRPTKLKMYAWTQHHRTSNSATRSNNCIVPPTTAVPFGFSSATLPPRPRIHCVPGLVRLQYPRRQMFGALYHCLFV